MLPCPKCKSRTDVYDSRFNPLNQLRRKRICPKCAYRFATLEVLDKQNVLSQVKDRNVKAKVEQVKPPPKTLNIKRAKGEAKPRNNFVDPDELLYENNDSVVNIQRNVFFD